MQGAVISKKGKVGKDQRRKSQPRRVLNREGLLNSSYQTTLDSRTVLIQQRQNMV